MKDISLVITIDTEEDNWNTLRGPKSVLNIRQIPELQKFLQGYGLRPTYLVTYPVAQDAFAAELLGTLCGDGRCEIGAHLHPWSTPPHIEANTPENSMLNNLSMDIKYHKLDVLSATIRKQLQVHPVSYRAGRWGFVEEDCKMLHDLGYKLDTSVTPFVSWESFSKGPNHEQLPFYPFLVDRNGNIKTEFSGDELLECPVTIGYNLRPIRASHITYRTIDKISSKKFPLLGLLSRTGILRKFWLSPELSDGKEMYKLAKIYVSHRFVDTLNLTFHSPSLKPGLTPFVRDQGDLKKFYKNLAYLFDSLFSTYKVTPYTLSEYFNRYVNNLAR
jgi:hypothetical protein